MFIFSFLIRLNHDISCIYIMSGFVLVKKQVKMLQTFQKNYPEIKVFLRLFNHWFDLTELVQTAL